MPKTRSPRPTYLVIPCGAEKLDRPAPARELYTGRMFTLCLAAAEAEAAGTEAATILVLSAKYGLVGIDEVIEPYDVKMGDRGSVTAGQVAAQAAERGIVYDAHPDVYAFLPNAYFACLDEALRADDVYAAQVYEGCGGIGEQRRVCRVVRDHDTLAA